MHASLFAAMTAGGSFTPAKPTLAYAAVGQFTITNYDANVTYNLSCTVGTASRSGATVTMTNTNSICTITPVNPKGTISGTASTYERKAYSYYFSQGYRCCPGWPGDCSCGNPAGCEYCSGWFQEYCYNNYTSSGYTWYGATLTCNGGTCSGTACATPAGEWIKMA